jgi:flagellar protein FliL
MASGGTNDKKSAAGKISATVWFGVMIVLTLIAGGIGGMFGLYLTSEAKMIMNPNATAAAEAPSPAHVEAPNVRDLPPIVTNMGQTSETWVRLQAAVVFDSTGIEKPDVMVKEIAGDILGFMQTLSVRQLTGPSGLQHLREDLNERAIMRSDGRVRELVIESLVVQ